MKNIFLITIFASMYVIPCVLFAKTVDTDNRYFDIKLDKVEYSQMVEKDFFQFNEPEIYPLGENKISSWQVKFICDRKMRINLKGEGKNICGKSIKLSYDKMADFGFLFDNQSEQTRHFALKFRAYNQKKNKIAELKKNFIWK